MWEQYEDCKKLISQEDLTSEEYENQIQKILKEIEENSQNETKEYGSRNRKIQRFDLSAKHCRETCKNTYQFFRPI